MTEKGEKQIQIDGERCGHMERGRDGRDSLEIVRGGR